MGSFVASEIVKKMVQKDIPSKRAKALLLGFTFKENCPDVRNTRVIDIYNDLIEFGLDVTVYDPWANYDEVKGEYGVSLENSIDISAIKYSCIVLAVSHDKFKELNLDFLKAQNSIVYDLKGFFPPEMIDARL